MSVTAKWAILFLALIIFIIILVCMKKGSKYTKMVKNSDSSLGELLVIGFGACDLINYQPKGEKTKKKITSFQILYGEKYGEYYFRMNLASKITSAMLCVIIGLIVSVLMDSAIIAALGIGVAAMCVYAFDTDLTDKTTEREESINRDFSEMLSTMALLVNAGMILVEAWEKTANMKDGTLYEEMRNAVDEMNNGASAGDAFINFARRCGSDQVTKFVSTLVQNMNKGNSELTILLQEFSKDAWNQKKEHARQLGEAASSKLLLPIGLMFVGILVMVCVPIFSNMGI